MPFDPALPVSDSEILSAELRGQFNGLKELIDAIPAGPPGPPGPEGAPGPQGVPGEVSYAQLTSAMGEVVAVSSANSNAVATLNTPFADPDAEALRVAFNTLLLALRR